MNLSIPTKAVEEAATNYSTGKSSADVFRKAHEDDFKSGIIFANDYHTQHTLPILERCREALSDALNLYNNIYAREGLSEVGLAQLHEIETALSELKQFDNDK